MIALARRLQNQLLEFRIPLFFESLPPFYVKDFCLDMFIFRQNIYLNFISLQYNESFTTNITILHISGNAVYQVTDYGHPERTFFFRKSQTFGVFSVNLSAPILVPRVPKGQIKSKAGLACRRFSQKTNERICFVCCEKQKSKKK